MSCSSKSNLKCPLLQKTLFHLETHPYLFPAKRSKLKIDPGNAAFAEPQTSRAFLFIKSVWKVWSKILLLVRLIVWYSHIYLHFIIQWKITTGFRRVCSHLRYALLMHEGGLFSLYWYLVLSLSYIDDIIKLSVWSPLYLYLVQDTYIWINNLKAWLTFSATIVFEWNVSQKSIFLIMLVLNDIYATKVTVVLCKINLCPWIIRKMSKQLVLKFLNNKCQTAVPNYAFYLRSMYKTYIFSRVEKIILFCIFANIFKSLKYFLENWILSKKLCS